MKSCRSGRFLRSAIFLLVIAVPVQAQQGGGGEQADSSALSGLTDKDRGRLSRMDESRAKGLRLAQLGDPKTFALITDIIGAPAQPINTRRLAGNWRCRTFSLGGNMGARFYAKKTGFFRCRIFREGKVLVLKKLSGSMSWLGILSPLNDKQMLYKGTAIARGDRIPLYPKGDAYGHRVGKLEQIGRNRLRMEMPEPTHFAQSSHDLIEFVRAR